MKVLHLVHGWYPESAGGTEGYIRDLLLGQRRLGIEPKLVCGSFTPWETAGIEEVEVQGERVLRVHRDDHWFDWHAKSWHPGVESLLEALFARERPDLIHVHHWIRLTCNIVEIADRLGIPAVVTLHDLYSSCPRVFRVRPGDEACFRPLSIASCRDCVPRMGHESMREIEAGIALFQDQYRSELALARAVITATSATADLIAEKAGIERAKFRSLPLGYEPRFPARAPTPAALPGRDEPLRLCYWGNLTRRKGTHVLVKAFRAVCERSRPGRYELHLAGKVDRGEFESELRELARDLPVVFHGRYSYEQLAGLGIHLAVFPMICFETFGFVLDECFELGLSAIVTDIGAMPERAGAAARIVPRNDVAALAAAIEEFGVAPEKLAAMRTRIPSRSPLPEEHAAQLRDIYVEALGSLRNRAEVIPMLRRAHFLLLQRESAERKIAPPGGPL